MSEEKKIIIDEDWKSQVESEKAAAAKETAEDPQPVAADNAVDNADDPGASPDDPPMPEAAIGMLMSSLATEALISMGQFPHPATGEVFRRPNQAKYLIDTLAMLKEKTEGNLSAEEAAALGDVLHQLRMAFVASK